MPRGTRAVREVNGSDAGPVMTMIFPATEFLTSSCWCGLKLVLVPQRDVLEGLTMSCDRGNCVDPTGHHDPGELVYDNGSASVGTGSSDPHARLRPFTYEEIANVVPTYVLRTRAWKPRLKAEAEVPRQDLDLWDRAVRRDVIKGWHEQGKTAKWIAHLLGLAVHTVYDDINWLRKKGML